MRIALSTLSCPDWDLRKICQRGSEYGYDGIDFRGLLDRIDISQMPQFGAFLDVSAGTIDSAGLDVSALSSSIWICDEGRRDENVAEAKHLIPLARELGAEYIHLKDAVYEPDHPDAMDDGWRYVIPGTGELPLADGLRVLEQRDYSGWVAFEHEKRWHPELPTPEEACSKFVRWFESVTSE